MSLVTLVILALGLSMDAFSVAIAKGMAARDMTLAKALRQAVVFGLVEAIAPIIGWMLGCAAHQWIQSVDHWIAFVLLFILGMRCIFGAWSDNEPNAEFGGGFWLFMTAIATSIDAIVIGISLAFLQANIWVAAVFIGIATTMMVTIGLTLGQRLGERFGRGAMSVGGLMLIVIGSYILYSHLNMTT